MTPRKKLQDIKGFSEAVAGKVIDAANKISPINTFRTANEVLQRRDKVVKITTGAQNLDEVLGGGVETASLTEFHGEFRTGKTQLCYTLAIACQTDPEEGGGGGKVFWLDTEGTFNPERLKPICDRFDIDYTAALENILTLRLYTTDALLDAPRLLHAQIMDDRDTGPFRLIIVDSVMALFRQDYSGRGELSERQQKLGQLLAHLKKIAETYNIAVVCTNQVTANPDGSMFAASAKPIGGNVLGHAMQTRVQLKKGRDNSRYGKVVQGPNLPEAQCQFVITEQGIQNED